LLYNRGRALQGLGRFPESLEQLEAFDRQAPADLKARVPALASLLAELRSKVATLTLTTNVDGARILVPDRIVGTTPPSGPLKLNAGRATVEIEADGYLPYRKDIDLPGAGTIDLNATLLPRSSTGILVVRSNVPGAAVAIDSKPAGNAPVELQLGAG